MSEAEARIWVETVPKVRARGDVYYVLAAYCVVAARISATSTPRSADLEERQGLAEQLGLEGTE